MLEEKKQRHFKAQRWLAGVLGFLILLSLAGGVFSPVAASLLKGERVPILILGTDVAEFSYHSDTLMLSVLDPLTGQFQFLSIPRDTRIRIPGFRFRRVNEIYGYHIRDSKKPDAAASKVLSAVKGMLSSESRPISLPYYIQVDFGAFRKIIDILGGVWVEVKTPMHYDDYAGNYHFHKEPGRYLMFGDEALHFVRFRGTTGDRGRILRQQEFLRSVAMRTANPINLFRFPKMVTAIASSVRSNMSFWDMMYFALSSKRVRPGKIGFYILPGKPRGPYWYMNKEATHNLAAALFLGDKLKEQALVPIVPQAGFITVQVWNASGRKGIAYQVTTYLREHGFDVVDYGTYSIEQIPTRVVDRTGKMSQAQAVAEALGVQHSHSEPDEDALADVEVIIGKNYNEIGVTD